MGQPDWSAPSDNATLALIQAQLGVIKTNTNPINGPLSNATLNVNTVLSPIFAAVGKQAVVIYNPSTTVTVWVGGAALVAGAGTPILPGAFHAWSLDGVTLYGVTSAGSSTVTLSYATVT